MKGPEDPWPVLAVGLTLVSVAAVFLGWLVTYFTMFVFHWAVVLPIGLVVGFRVGTRHPLLMPAIGGGVAWLALAVWGASGLWASYIVASYALAVTAASGASGTRFRISGALQAYVATLVVMVAEVFVARIEATWPGLLGYIMLPPAAYGIGRLCALPAAAIEGNQPPWSWFFLAFPVGLAILLATSTIDQDELMDSFRLLSPVGIVAAVAAALATIRPLANPPPRKPAVNH